VILYCLLLRNYHTPSLCVDTVSHGLPKN